MNKVLVSRKGGYSIWADVNPRTNRLFNYTITGANISSKATYTYVSEAEDIVRHHLERRQK